jgi:hypothetical protein
MSTSQRLVCASLAASACVIAACGAPSIATRLQGTLVVSGSDTYNGEVLFEIPAHLNVDCSTYARRGLYADQQRLQLLFAPRQLTQDAPLQQLAISIANYSGPGRYAIDASTLRFSLRSRGLASVNPGSELVVAPDGSGSMGATGLLEGGGDVRIDLTFACMAA